MIKKISRKAPLFMAACMAIALVLAGCGGSGSPADRGTGGVYHTVTFHVHGGSTVQAQSVRDGETATRPTANPTRSGFTFTNWFTAQTGGSVFDFATPITGDTAIHAQWQPAQVVITVTGFSSWLLGQIEGGGVYLTLLTWKPHPTPDVHHARGEGIVQDDQAVFKMFMYYEGEITEQPFTTTGSFGMMLGDHLGVSVDDVNITGGSQTIDSSTSWEWF